MDQTRDEVLGTFMSLTGLDEGVAFSFLDSTNWNLEESLHLFEASSGAPSASDTQGKTSPKSNKSGAKNSNRKKPSNESSKNAVDLSQDEYDYDENGEYVRAPLPIKTEVLLPSGMGSGMRARQPNFDPRSPQTVFEMFRDFRKETQVLEDNVDSNGNKKIQRLGTLFRPPVEIISREEFDSAKASAATAKRWLLVNIQDATEFDSQKLNRDTWSDGELKKMITKNFVFWQRYHDSDDGKRYCRFYPQAEIKPHIGLIDPRTGELIRFWSGFVDSATLKKEISEFLEENTLEGYAPVKKPAPKKNLLDCSEEEQLAAVIAESLKSQGGNSPSASISIEEESNSNTTTTTNKRKATETPVKEQETKKIKTPEPAKAETSQKASAAQSKPQATPTPAPQVPLPMDEGTGDCVVQIRDTSGTTLKRNFNSTDTLQSIHDWVAPRRSDKSHFSFVSQFPRRTFSGKDLSQTIQEANLGKRFVLIVELNS